MGMQEMKGADVEARKVVDNINRELRQQYMHACRDKRRLEKELEEAQRIASCAGIPSG
jgi:hypothetical protein